MKLKVISQEGNIFTIKYTPSRFARFFGAKEYTKKWKKDPDTYYTFGIGYVYYDQEGNENGSLSKEAEVLSRYKNAWED